MFKPEPLHPSLASHKDTNCVAFAFEPYDQQQMCSTNVSPKSDELFGAKHKTPTNKTMFHLEHKLTHKLYRTAVLFNKLPNNSKCLQAPANYK